MPAEILSSQTASIVMLRRVCTLVLEYELCWNLVWCNSFGAFGAGCAKPNSSTVLVGSE
jgi:hypothetical protein